MKALRVRPDMYIRTYALFDCCGRVRESVNVQMSADDVVGPFMPELLQRMPPGSDLFFNCSDDLNKLSRVHSRSCTPHSLCMHKLSPYGRDFGVSFCFTCDGLLGPLMLFVGVLLRIFGHRKW